MSFEIKHSDRLSTIFSLLIFILVISLILFVSTMFILEEFIPYPTLDNIMILIGIIITLCIITGIMVIIISASGEKISIDNQGIFIENSDVNFSIEWHEIEILTIIETFRDDKYTDGEGNYSGDYKREMKLKKYDGKEEKVNIKFLSTNIETKKIVKVFNNYLNRDAEIDRDEREYENYNWTRIHYFWK